MTALALLAAPAASAVAVGDKAPDCELSALGAGQAGKLSQYKGKVVYVDFWASWCGPCAQSFPFLNELHKQLGGQGLQIVGVNMDENADDANTFLAKIPASFPVAADASKQCAKDFDVQAMPSSYIIDNKGVVHHIHLGFRPGAADELQSTIQGLLSAK
ncbi:MAG: TlpA disulfide reductase family protein [Methylococcales bacterium]|nr:TlpA disulfide reductase family protein [Methylococcales bacterium]